MHDHQKSAATNGAVHQTQETTAAKRQKVADRRIERLEDLLAQALEAPDPLQASLRAAVADLLEISYRLGAGIKAALEVVPVDLTAQAEAIRAIDKLALLHRQATRYVQLDQERAAEENPGGMAQRQPLNASNGAGETAI